MATDPRAHQVAENEEIFRRGDDDTAELVLVCECGRLGCGARLRIPVREYGWIRDVGGRYVIATGHDHPHGERVVDRGGGWLVIEVVGPHEGRPRSEADLV
jgi:hypothetical protein